MPDDKQNNALERDAAQGVGTPTSPEASSASFWDEHRREINALLLSVGISSGLLATYLAIGRYKRHAKTEEEKKILGEMQKRLSTHNPESKYSEAAISRYLDTYFEAPETTTEASNSEPLLIDWNEKKSAIAHLISHLPDYAQTLLMENGNALVLHADLESLNTARNPGDVQSKRVTGFFRPAERSIHWPIGGNYSTLTALHEIGHGVDYDSWSFIADKPSIGLASAIEKHLARTTSLTPPSYHADVFQRVNNRTLSEHLHSYTIDGYSKETVAELFAERTMLSWQYPNAPEKIEQILLKKYPEIWPVMRDQYLPEMENLAGETQRKRQQTVDTVVERRAALENLAPDSPKMQDFRATLSGVTLPELRHLSVEYYEVKEHRDSEMFRTCMERYIGAKGIDAYIQNQEGIYEGLFKLSCDTNNNTQEMLKYIDGVIAGEIDPYAHARFDAENYFVLHTTPEHALKVQDLLEAHGIQNRFVNFTNDEQGCLLVVDRHRIDGSFDNNYADKIPAEVITQIQNEADALVKSGAPRRTREETMIDIWMDNLEATQNLIVALKERGIESEIRNGNVCLTPEEFKKITMKEILAINDAVNAHLVPKMPELTLASSSKPAAVQTASSSTSATDASKLASVNHVPLMTKGIVASFNAFAPNSADAFQSIDRAIAADPEKYKPRNAMRGDLMAGSYETTTTYDTPFGKKVITEVNGTNPQVRYEPARNPLELPWKQEYSREQLKNVWRVDATDMTPLERQHVVDHLASQGVAAKAFQPLFGGKAVYIDVPSGNAALRGAEPKDFARILTEFYIPSASAAPSTSTFSATHSLENAAIAFTASYNAGDGMGTANTTSPSLPPLDNTPLLYDPPLPAALEAQHALQEVQAKNQQASHMVAGISGEHAETIMQWVVQRTRVGLLNEERMSNPESPVSLEAFFAGEDVMPERCVKALSLAAPQTSRGWEIETFRHQTDRLLKNGHAGHAFLVAALPVTTAAGTVEKSYYLIDPTFRQFTKRDNPDPWVQEMIKTPEGHALVQGLLTHGYMPLTEQTAEIYLGSHVKIAEEKAQSPKPSPQVKGHALELLSQESYTTGIFDFADDLLEVGEHRIDLRSPQMVVGSGDEAMFKAPANETGSAAAHNAAGEFNAATTSIATTPTAGATNTPTSAPAQSNSVSDPMLTTSHTTALPGTTTDAAAAVGAAPISISVAAPAGDLGVSAGTAATSDMNIAPVMPAHDIAAPAGVAAAPSTAGHSTAAAPMTNTASYTMAGLPGTTAGNVTDGSQGIGISSTTNDAANNTHASMAGDGHSNSHTPPAADHANGNSETTPPAGNSNENHIAPSGRAVPALATHIDIHGNGTVGLVMGGMALYGKLQSGSTFHQDIAAGGKRSTYAKAGITSDVAGVVTGGGSWLAQAKQANLVARTESVVMSEFEALANTAKIARFGKYAKGLGIVGQVAAVVSGGFEVAAANEVGDGHRAARATGSTVGGIALGAGGTILAATAAGSVVPVVGNAVGAVIGVVIVGVSAWAGSELGGEAAEALAGDDWQAHYDEKTKQKIATIENTVKNTGAKIQAAMDAADHYEQALTKLDAAFRGKDPKTLQAAYKEYQQSLVALNGIKPIPKAEKDAYLNAKHEVEKQLGYQQQHSVKNPALMNQMGTLIALMDNSWLQINAMDMGGIISSSNNAQFGYCKETVTMDAKLAKIVPQRVQEIHKAHAQESYQGTCMQWDKLSAEKSQPKLKALTGLHEIAEQLQKKMDNHTVTPQDIEEAKGYMAKLSPLLKKELSAIYTYEKQLLALQKQHHTALHDADYKDLNKKLGIPVDQALAEIIKLRDELKKGVPAVLIQTIAMAEQSIAPTSSIAATQAAPISTTALTDDHSATLNALVAQNPAFANPALQASLKAEAAKLINYYTKGTDEKGADISNGNATLKDGKLDEKEMRDAIAKLNTTFKDRGVTIAAANAAQQLPQGTASTKGIGV